MNDAQILALLAAFNGSGQLVQPASDPAAADYNVVRPLRGKGIADEEALILVKRLARRDEMLDDRRSCAECVSYDAGRCRQRITPIGEATIYTLHRCRGFKLDECLDE